MSRVFAGVNRWGIGAGGRKQGSMVQVRKEHDSGLACWNRCSTGSNGILRLPKEPRAVAARGGARVEDREYLRGVVRQSKSGLNLDEGGRRTKLCGNSDALTCSGVMCVIVTTEALGAADCPGC